MKVKEIYCALRVSNRNDEFKAAQLTKSSNREMKRTRRTRFRKLAGTGASAAMVEMMDGR